MLSDNLTEDLRDDLDERCKWEGKPYNDFSPRRADMRWSTRAIMAESEIELLLQRLADVITAIDDEPELPGGMPDELLKNIERIGMEKSMRILVRLTKDGIRNRIKEQQLAEATNEVEGGDAH